MRVPISWLAEHVDLPAGLAPRELGEALIRVGMEVEGVESAADELSGPIVVGRVLSLEPEPQKNGKTINWCHGRRRGGAQRRPVRRSPERARAASCAVRTTSVVGDLVVVSRCPVRSCRVVSPSAARKTYGHVSDGMICSVRELGIGDEHDGILVLPAGLRVTRATIRSRCSVWTTPCSTSPPRPTAGYTPVRSVGSPARRPRVRSMSRSTTSAARTADRWTARRVRRPSSTTRPAV